jgi:replication factor C large subunit
MWTEKYRPKSLKEFVNQKEALEKFLAWIKKWKPGSKALLFYGPPGVGKTALLQAYATEKGLDLIEMNASDYRSAQQIHEVLGQSMKQRSLFGRGKIFLLDEIDGIVGTEDRGGVGEIIKIIQESSFPLILTANNPWEPKLRALREYCQLVEFKKIYVFDVEKRLAEICKKERIAVEKDVLRDLARMCGGDLRAAINDLETVARGKRKIVLSDLEVLGYRETERSVFDALKIVFKSKSALAAKLSISNVDKDPEEIFWWIENNIAREYEDPEEIAKAYDALSKADIFRQWVVSRQDWRLKGYMIDIMTGGVAIAKKEMYRKFTKYQYPSKIAMLGQTKFERKEEKEKLLELSRQLHCSTRKIRKDFLPFLRIIFKKAKLLM